MPVDNQPPIKPEGHYPDPILDLKNTYIEIDGKRYEVAELLRRVVRDLKGD